VITWRVGNVVSLGKSWSGAQELEVVDDGGRRVRALAYPLLVGRVAVGSRVALNSSALDRGLGTGGYALVAAVLPERGVAEPGVADFGAAAGAQGAGAQGTGAGAGAGAGGPGHLVKARYTPTQAMVLGVDEQESEFHSVLADADSIDGMPVVTADLHSALPAILAGIRRDAGSSADTGSSANAGGVKVAYVMTDGGALPAWFSRSVSQLRDAGWLDSVISVGQAFGGDLEAVTVHTGLLAARHVVGADIAVVIQGPGNLGTGTRWGFSGVAVGEAMNAAAVLGGIPIGSLRISSGDLRERHLGISHHSMTALGRVALAPGRVVVPRFDPAGSLFSGFALAQESASWQDIATLIDGQRRALERMAPQHQLVDVDVDEALHQALEASPVRLSTMGRGYGQDPLAFLAAAAAGFYAVGLVTG